MPEQPTQQHTEPMGVTPDVIDTLPSTRKSARRVLGGAALAVIATVGVAYNTSKDSKPTTNTDPAAIMLANDGLISGDTESPYAIAGAGSCSPYTQADGANVLRGTFKPTKDLKVAETEFLSQHIDFATNFATTSESRLSPMYDALGIDKPSKDPSKADQQIAAIFNSPNYVTAPLASSTAVQNTLCDTSGNLHDYRRVDLASGTYVGGAIIKQQTKDANGNTITEFMNGNKVALPANALVVKVLQEDGSTKLMYATNKAGVNADGDFEAEVGCLNVITSIPPETVETVPMTVPTTSTVPNKVTTTTVVPGSSTSSTTTGSTSSTTVVVTTTSPAKDARPTPDPRPNSTSSTTEPAPDGQNVSPNSSPTTSSTSTTVVYTSPSPSNPNTPPQTTTTTMAGGNNGTTTTTQAPPTTQPPAPAG